ncbi:MULTISPECIES: hypothetical protein [unclassified Paraburkholderia]|uniref:hypothetical protein n=1 Tax=unclassified Paraburkholderia TaxID=2615204 RepID=UPI002AB20DEA|nr:MULTISPECIES: hypothetical protein [unclassified Paraburkholderia]
MDKAAVVDQLVTGWHEHLVRYIKDIDAFQNKNEYIPSALDKSRTARIDAASTQIHFRHHRDTGIPLAGMRDAVARISIDARSAKVTAKLSVNLAKNYHTTNAAC